MTTNDICRSRCKTCGGDIPLPKCTICGGDLYEVKDDKISKYCSDLPDSMKGKSYLFTGLKCIDCENRQSGSFKLLETSCDS